MRALPRELLLLTRGQLLQSLERLVGLLRAALLARALHLVVLIPHLVRLELEQIGEVGRVGATTAAAAATLLLHAHLHFTECGFGLLEPLQRALLRRKRVVGPPLHQQLLGGLHFDSRFRKHVGENAETRIGGLRCRSCDALLQRCQLLSQAPLRQQQRADVATQRRRRCGGTIALGLERRSDDVTLTLHERSWIHLLLTASTAAAALLILLVLAAEWADGEKLDIAAARLGAGPLIVVERTRVVAHHITSGEVHLLEEERVRRDDVTRPHTSALRERDRPLVAAVHAIDQLEFSDAVVIRCLRLDQHFVNAGRAQITTGLLDAHGRCRVIECIDCVFHGFTHDGAIGRRQFDPIKSIAPNAQTRRHRGIVLPRQWDSGAVVENQRTSGDWSRCEHTQQRRRAVWCGNVSSVVSDLG